MQVLGGAAVHGGEVGYTYVPGYVHDCLEAGRGLAGKAGASSAGAGAARSGIGLRQNGNASRGGNHCPRGEGEDASTPSGAANGNSAMCGEEGTMHANGADNGGEGREAERSLQVLVWDPVATYELKGLPLVYAKAPLLWIPRALRDRVCAILCGLL